MQRHKRLLLLCLLLFVSSLAFAVAEEHRPSHSETQISPLLAETKEFWVWDLSVMPPGFRKARATVRAEGARSRIFVEEKLWESNITSSYVNTLHYHLEQEASKDAFLPNLGIVPLEERIFNPLPDSPSSDDRVIVLFADLGQYKDYQFDGFYNGFDQMKEEEAWSKYQQHSNEANIIYINGLRLNELYTTGVIAHELQHLISHVDAKENFQRDLWLSETLAEGAMILTGYFTDQAHVNRFAKASFQYPLVSHTYVQYGPQLLFASYILDSFYLDRGTTLGRLTKMRKPGREAIEALFRDLTGTPVTFDVIYSNYLSYIFDYSGNSMVLPLSRTDLDKKGIQIPKFEPYVTLDTLPAQVEGTVFPYSFAVIQLPKELPPSAIVEVNNPQLAEKVQEGPSVTDSCAYKASVLWKPIDATRIAVYAVGCEHKSAADRVPFRLKVLDKSFPSVTTKHTLSH